MTIPSHDLDFGQSLNKCLVQTRSAIPIFEIKTESVTDRPISFSLISDDFASSAPGRTLSLDWSGLS